MQKSSIQEEKFIKNFTPESSYILGLLFADGHLNKNSNEIRISCISDDMISFQPIFQKTGNWNIYFTDFSKYKIRNGKQQTILSCSSKFLHNLLSNEKYFLLDKIPINLKHYWLRGFIDGDGCWTISESNKKYKNKIYKNINRKFAATSCYDFDWYFFENILKKLNINYNISKYKNKNSYSQLTITGLNNYLKLGYYLYNDFESFPMRT